MTFCLVMGFVQEIKKKLPENGKFLHLPTLQLDCCPFSRRFGCVMLVAANVALRYQPQNDAEVSSHLSTFTVGPSGH